MNLHGITQAAGLTDAERDSLSALVTLYGKRMGRNTLIEHYYEGDVMVRDIGVDILPDGADVSVDLRCDWGRKAVDELANIVRFDGFVFSDGEDAELGTSMSLNNFASTFARYRIGVLKKGCAFVTVGRDALGHAMVRFHGADNAAGFMDVTGDRLSCGFAIADTRRTPWSRLVPVPTLVNYYEPGKQVSIVRDDQSRWHIERVDTPPDTMMMVPLVNSPTETKPLGNSRISGPVRDIIDDVLRVRFALALSTAFYAIPMRALLGLTDNVYERLSKQSKWTTYINPMILATMDRNGHTPTLAQLPANSPQPLIQIIENDARQFCSITGIPLNSLSVEQQGTVSADAIQERRKSLTDEAQDLIDGQLKPALRQVALLVMMVEHNRTMEQLDDTQLSVMARFENPAMPSVAARTDAAMKIASVNPSFAQTDVFFEMVGFTQEDIRRVNKQMRRNAAMQSFGTMLRSGDAAQQPQQTTMDEVSNEN